MLRFSHLAAAVAATVCAGGLVSGCGGASGSKGSPTHKATQAAFDPRRFGAPTADANQWLPLRPGMQWVRDGGTDVGHRRVPHRVIRTVTSVSRQVDGVRTVAVMDRDVDAGQVAQESLDYLAQDRNGNVWSMGGYTEEYEGGRFVAVRDAWLSGVKGGRGGILMLAAPRAGTAPYSIARPPGADPDVAQVVKSGQAQCVPLRCFNQVLVIREGKASAPDNEFKYYAPGVGQILNTPRSASKHHDVERLINFTQLSPKGLAEVNAEALKLDHHARVTKADVFGLGAPATQRGV
jgi:hypothetical protein